MAKSTSKKPAAKKAAPKKTAKASKSKEVIKVNPAEIQLAPMQQKTLDMVQKNQEKIEAKAIDMLKIANDSGDRLIKLKNDVQKAYGRVWKQWASIPGNLPISYEQATRYMKLAGATDEEFEAIEGNATSIESAVKQIEHMRKPEKKAAADKAKAEKKAQKTATDGIISNATLDEVERATSIKDLRDLIALCHARIEELENLGEGGDDDVIDGNSTEIDDESYDESDEADDIANALS